MKKTINTLVAFNFLTNIFCCQAHSDESNNNPQPKYYNLYEDCRIGLGVAAEYMHFDTNLEILPIGRLGNFGNKQSQTGKRLQVAPSIELGKIINDFYLGLFISWRYSGATNSTLAPIRSGSYYIHDFKLKHYTDILLKLGYKINPRTMLYGLVGPSIASWSHTSYAQNSLQGVTDRFDMSRTRAGLGVGLGFEYMFKKKYAFSFDYTYHVQRSISQSRGLTIVDGIPRAGTIIKTISPSYSTVALRFTYFFNY